eukprot:CAMPEP_0170551872 /NCGR_PEP_ID=MMETSP0211-20121228/9867_1 /TAXON_ID=311385 /ORGANISM="Pseudokeronopsis sp., Strain OXSARD2" /LENGTH=114 /DNA_ID=CAMNT_0010859315 /DNA_START=1858 /DNA_END=2202 /DNA_ORIENTATION=+
MCYISDSSSSSSYCSSCQVSQSDCNCSCSCSSAAISSSRQSKLHRKVTGHDNYNPNNPEGGTNKKPFIKKHKNGKYQLQVKDESSNTVFRINAPNELVFNENLQFTIDDNLRKC